MSRAISWRSRSPRTSLLHRQPAGVARRGRTSLRRVATDRPGYGFVCGMYTFGLEENGQYEAAEEQARRALEANPRDVWAVHAQAHVFEMRGAQRLGVAFLDRTAQDWSSSYFATHNWWHRALYHLELRETDEALALYDGPIRCTRSTSGSTWTTRRRCCAGTSSGSTSATEPEHCSRTSRAVGRARRRIQRLARVMSAGLAGAHESASDSSWATGGTKDQSPRHRRGRPPAPGGFCRLRQRRLRPGAESARRPAAEGPLRGRQPRAERRDRPDPDGRGS